MSELCDVHHVSFVIAGVDRSLKFYCGVLGLEGAGSACRIQCENLQVLEGRLEAVDIAFARSRSGRRVQQPVCHRHVKEQGAATTF